MSKCWICGKEMTKTIGGCEQCSDCGVGLDDLVFRTRNNSKDNSLDKFVEKYPTYIEALDIIDDLKKQLERHNKYFNSFSCDSFDEFADFISTFMLTPHEEQTLIKDLEKQLKEKDKKIETLQTHFKKTQELLAREMGGSTIVIDNLQKEMKQALANQKDYYEKKLKSQPKEIVEKIKNKIPEIGGMKCEIIINDFLTLNTLLDNILKEYQK